MSINYTTCPKEGQDLIYFGLIICDFKAFDRLLHSYGRKTIAAKPMPSKDGLPDDYLIPINLPFDLGNAAYSLESNARLLTGSEAVYALAYLNCPDHMIDRLYSDAWQLTEADIERLLAESDGVAW